MTTRMVAGLVATATLTAGCAQAGTSGGGADDRALERRDAEVSTEIIGFDDDLHRYVVLTTSHPAASALLPAADPAVSEASTGDEQPAGDGTLVGTLPVWTADGRTDIAFGPGDLTAVVPTADEQVLIDEASVVSMVAFVVVDVAGAAGVPGARYLYVDGVLRRSAEPAPAGEEIERDDASVAAEISAIDGVVAVDNPAPGLLAVTSSQPLDELAQLPGVASAAPEVLFGLTDDPDQGRQWAIRNTGDPTQAGGWPGTAGIDPGAPAAWNVATGAGVTVAVVDSGVQLDHPDLASQIAANSLDVCGDNVDGDGNGFVDDCRGWDFGDLDNDPSPSPSASNHGHGTHVAGIVAAARNGVGTVGIAPDARILPIKVSRSTGAITMSGLIAAIQYAADRGADVINLSLSTGPGVPRSSVAQLEAAVAYAGNRGVLVVAASGNNGTDITANPAWPASFSDLYPFVITVGAHTNTGDRASFSNFGSPIDVVAPGFWIYATWVGGGQTFQSGTSMATPAVAGAAAVVLSQTDRSPAEVRNVLTTTGQPSASGPRLDVAAAVGVSREGQWSVAYRGADQLRADVAGGLDVEVSAGILTAAAMRISVATLDLGSVVAVGGLGAQITGGNGTQSVATGDDGSFPVVPLAGDLTTGSAVRLDSLSLPAGPYALVHELLDASGTPVAPPQVVYLSVTAGSSATTTVPAAPTTTTPAAPTTTTPAATTTVPAAPTTTRPPSSGTGGGAPAPTTTTTRPPSAPAPTTTTTRPPSAPAPTTTTTRPPSAPAPTTTTTRPPSAPVTTIPPTTVPTTTTPPPPPDQSGGWSLTSMDPRAADIAGGTRVVLSGRFPTWVPVYVWFGNSAVVRADVSEDRLVVTTPPMDCAGVTDVTVRFRTSASFELTLPAAFTFFGTRPAPGGTTPTTTPTTSPPANPPSGPAPSTTTVPPAPPSPTTTSPAQPSPTTTVPPAPPSPTTTSPAQPSPTTTTPAQPSPTTTTSPAQPSPTTVPATTVPRTRGSLALRPVSSGSSLAGLAASRWPATGCAATCTGRSL